MTQYVHNRPSRRTFLKLGAISVAIGPVANLLMSTEVQAKRVPQQTPLDESALSVDDPQAKALHYMEDASAANSTGRKDHQFCMTCQLYSGSPDAEWGPCAIFSYRNNPKTNSPFVVRAQGWCQGWGPRASAR
jgi:hypothetical protein